MALLWMDQWGATVKLDICPFATNNVGLYFTVPVCLKRQELLNCPDLAGVFTSSQEKLTRDTNGDGRTNQYGIYKP